MKSRLSIIVGALLVMFATFWAMRHHGSAPAPEMAAVIAATPIPAVGIQAPALAAPVPPLSAANSDDSKTPSAMLVKVGTDGALNYTAHAGDTVSQLATALMGSDSKSNRDAVIAANPSLAVNPDRVLAGQTYCISATPHRPAEAPQAADDERPSIPPVAKTDATNSPVAGAQRELKYTAQHGDTVSSLAANLLGGDTKDNRKTITDSNASLQDDPNRLVAGTTYTIVTTGGLTAAPTAALPTTRADDDDAAGKNRVGRELRYTAQPGDTLSKLATVLLGADTKANRDLIEETNPSLKQDPDRLVAGQTYWIAAPTAGTIH